MVLGEVEQAFKEIKGDLLVQSIHYQRDEMIEAHIFVAFQSYCLNITLKQRVKRSLVKKVELSDPYGTDPK